MRGRARVASRPRSVAGLPLDLPHEPQGGDRVGVAAQLGLGRQLAGDQPVGDRLLGPLGQAGVVEDAVIKLPTGHARGMIAHRPASLQRAGRIDDSVGWADDDA